MFIKRFLCLINGFFEKDEYLQFVIRREAFFSSGALVARKKRQRRDEEERQESSRSRVGTGKSIKLKGKKDQRRDADEIQGECISRA